MLAYLKISTLLITLIFYFLSAIPAYPLLKRMPFASRRYLTKVVSFYSKLLLIILGIRLKIKGDQKIPPGKLIICNHTSYLDIFILASTFPSCFVTSYEMKEAFGLGQICSLAGCLFVERRNRENISTEVSHLADALKNGLNIGLFPEARTTDGTKVHEFKRSLFHAAVVANCDTLPLCINYKNINSKKINLRNKDNIFWYGDSISFGKHFKNLCRQNSIEAEINILPVITQHDVGNDSKALRDKTHEVISRSYINPV